MIKEAAIARRVRPRGILWRGPEEAQRGEGAISGLGTVDPAVFDADRIRAVGGQAVGRRGQVPEEVEGFVLEGIEESDGVGRDARAPGVTRTASEDQGKDDGYATTTAFRQNPSSAPIWKRRGSFTGPEIVPSLL